MKFNTNCLYEEEHTRPMFNVSEEKYIYICLELPSRNKFSEVSSNQPVNGACASGDSEIVSASFIRNWCDK